MNEYNFSIKVGEHIFEIKTDEDDWFFPKEPNLTPLPWIKRNHDHERGWTFTFLDIRNGQINAPEKRSPDWLMWAEQEWKEYYPLYQQAVIEAEKYLGLV